MSSNSNNITLNACLDTADALESALAGLGDTSAWPAYPEFQRRCRTFREECRELVEQKGLGELAIAFIGPKNAGKTTLLSMLVRSRTLIEKLHAGVSASAATEKITWIGARPVQDLDRDVEQSWHAAPSELVNLGAHYTLVDVPGSNEANQERAKAAERALRAAHLKVLVVDARTIEDASIINYLEKADGACLLPVINQIRPGIEEADIGVFIAKLKNALPSATILPPMRIRDFLLETEADAAEFERRAADELRQRLSDAVKTRGLSEMLEPQLVRLQTRFQEEMKRDLSAALPATAAAMHELQQAESTLAVKALERLLGAEDDNRLVLTGLRQQLRGLYQQRTSVLFFPWRTLVGLANLLHGAMEKVPFLLVGSLPSLATSAMTAVKNVARNREFGESRGNGLRKHAELIVKESLNGRVNNLELAIRSDLRSEERRQSADELEVSFEGLELLQERSTSLFRDVLERQALSKVGVHVTGLVGMLIFWSIFIWPLVALYTDYFGAVKHLWDGGAPAQDITGLGHDGQHLHFPAHSLPMLLTSFLLAVFPALFWLLLVLNWASHHGRARAALESLRGGHHRLIESLNENKQLRVRVSHPRLKACMNLFGFR